jgi:hypothetical protein
MLKAWRFYKERDFSNAFIALADIPDLPIRLACTRWIVRRGQPE